MSLNPAPLPRRVTLEGSYVRLEPATAAHAADLFAARTPPDADERFRYLPEPPADYPAFEDWLADQTMDDPVLFALVDPDTGRAGGWQQFMRIVPEHGVIELGNVYWGPDMARTRRATEAVYLTARHIFEELGYRRFEWKCNDQNLPSRRAAERFGFTYEGTFRQHMIFRGENRDTAWFAMLDGDWPAIRAAFERWLDPANFDADGMQKSRLTVPRV